MLVHFPSQALSATFIFLEINVYYNVFIVNLQYIFRRHNNMIYLLNFNITYIFTLLHVSTLMSHLQA